MTNLYQYCFNYLKNSPAIIEMTWGLIAVLIITIVVLIIYLKYTRTRLRLKARIEATYRKKYEADIIEYLYSGDNIVAITDIQKKIVAYLRKCTHGITGSGLKRKIIINTLLKLRNEVSGQTAADIQELYYQAGFIDQAYAKLKSKEWDVIARAIKELAQFGIKEVHDEVILHINHPKQEVRREIQYYLVNLFSFDGLEFLDVIETQLSEWDQIQLLEILQKNNNDQLPDISNWLQSANDSVISFALKLAKIYNQFEVNEELLALTNHPNVEIRVQVIEIISPLELMDIFMVVKNTIEDRSNEEKIAFFSIDAQLLTTLGANFMMNYVTHEDFEIRNAAKNCIRIIDINEANYININQLIEDDLPIENLTKAC